MAKEFAEAVEVLRKFGEDTVKAIQQNMDRKKINASKNLRQSLNYHVVTTETFTRLTVDFGKADYAAYVDSGRGPTKNKGGGKGATLEERLRGAYGWIAHKGIAPKMTIQLKRKTKTGIKIYTKTFKDIIEANRSLAYMIARKIHSKGYRPTHFYSEVVTPKIFDKLRTDIRAAAKKDILIQIKAGL